MAVSLWPDVQDERAVLLAFTPSAYVTCYHCCSVAKVQMCHAAAVQHQFSIAVVMEPMRVISYVAANGHFVDLVFRCVDALEGVFCAILGAVTINLLWNFLYWNMTVQYAVCNTGTCYQMKHPGGPPCWCVALDHIPARSVRTVPAWF
jgi:hypothetical protein